MLVQRVPSGADWSLDRADRVRHLLLGTMKLFHHLGREMSYEGGTNTHGRSPVWEEPSLTRVGTQPPPQAPVAVSGVCAGCAAGV